MMQKKKYSNRTHRKTVKHSNKNNLAIKTQKIVAEKKV